MAVNVLSGQAVYFGPAYGINHNIKGGNKYSETAEQYKYFETTLTHENSSLEGIKADRSQEMICSIWSSKFFL